MKTEELKKEKMGNYRPIFIDRRTGEETLATYTVSLFPSEVLRKQVELSTAKTVVLMRDIKKAEGRIE